MNMLDNLGRILMVEDDPKDVELTLTALEDYNLTNEVVVTRDGEEALNYLYRRGSFKARGNENPAVLLLDLKLPKIDGLEVLQQMKSDEALKMIPVVVLTSSREERDMVASYKLGVNAYVVKPVDFHEFVNAIKELGMFWAIVNEPPPGRWTTANRSNVTRPTIRPRSATKPFSYLKNFVFCIARSNHWFTSLKFRKSHVTK